MKISALIAATLALLAFAIPTSESTAASLILKAADPIHEVDRSPLAPFHVVKLLMSWEKQHVGHMRSETFYDIIKAAIAEACPFGRTGDACDVKKAWQQHGIKYYDAKNDRIANNAHITIRVLHAYFPSGYDRLREIFIHHVGRAFVDEVEDDKNCYTIKNVRMCNVGRYVDLLIPEINAQLMVEIKFNGHTNRCVFDCRALIEKQYGTCERLRAQYAECLRVPNTPQDVQCNVMCWTLEEFETLPAVPAPTDIQRFHLQVIDGKEILVPYDGPDDFVDASTGQVACAPE